MDKWVISAIIFIILINSVYAITTLETVNTNQKYPDVNVRDNGIISSKWYLISNTEHCSDECEALIKIENLAEYTLPSIKTGSNSTIIFREQSDKTKEKLPKITNIEFAVKNKTIQRIIGYSCTNITLVNGSIQNNCNIPITNTISIPDYQELKDGTKLPVGTIYIHLTGQKDYRDNIDWIIKFKELIFPWANWSQTGLGYDLVAYWNFDTNLSNKLIDVHSGKWNLTCLGINGCKLPNGIINKSVSLNGTKPYPLVVNAGTGDLLGINGNTISINCWTLRSNTNNYQAILSANSTSLVGNYFFWNVRETEKPMFEGLIQASAGNQTGVNRWYMQTITVNNGAWIIYINGTRVASGTGMAWKNDSATFGLGDTNNGGIAFEGMIDECGVWNRSLGVSEIANLYNGHLGLEYGFDNETNEIIINITSPSDNYILNNEVMEVSINISNPYNYTLKNITFDIYNQQNIKQFQNYTSMNNNTSTSIKMNISMKIDNYAHYKYNFTLAYYNSSIPVYSNTKNFINALKVNIVNNVNTLISDGICTINGNSYTSNLIYYPINLMSDYTQESLTVNASSSSNLYKANNSIIIINVSNQNYLNITLDYLKLLLNFTKNGNPVNASGYLASLNNTFTFSNTSFSIMQSLLGTGNILIRFINGSYAYNYITWSNVSQYYEYINDEYSSIEEVIEIFNKIDSTAYFQLQDNSGNIIKDATIRLYATIPANKSDDNSTFRFYGQRISDNNGKFLFQMDKEAEIYITLSKTGYQVKTIRLKASEISASTSDAPIIVRLEKTSYTQKDNVFISDLYKINGTKVYQSKFDNLNYDYFFYIYDYYGRDIKFSTSYEGTNRSVSMDSDTKSGVIYLNSGQQFSNTLNNTWYVYIYIDDALIYTISMEYGSTNPSIIISTEGKGLDNNSAWKVVIFLGLIIISSFIAIVFNTPSGEAGVHTFFIGSFITSLIVSSLGWLAVMGVFFYLGKMIKGWISE